MTIEKLESLISDDKLRLIIENTYKHLEIGDTAKIEFLGSDGRTYIIPISRAK